MCVRLSLPGIYEDDSAFSLTIVYYVHTKLGIGSMSEIQQQLAELSRPMRQLASRFTYSERQRTEETANAAVMQAAQKDKEERRKGLEV